MRLDTRMCNWRASLLTHGSSRRAFERSHNDNREYNCDQNQSKDRFQHGNCLLWWRRWGDLLLVFNGQS
jgi:hypothetical protein